jgi:hypothetical protein
MAVATADDVNRTPSPQMTLADRCVKHFIERITKRRQLPLLKLPRDDMALGGCAPPSLPKRSRWIAGQGIAHIPAAKRGEYLVMKLLGLSSERPSPLMLAKKAYNKISNGDPAHMQTLRELFPAIGEVGACKQRRCSAARA